MSCIALCYCYRLGAWQLDVSYIILSICRVIGLVRWHDTSAHRRSDALPVSSHNRIYYGQVHHTRLFPFYNRFTYSVFYPFVELNDYTHHAFDQYWLWYTRACSYACHNVGVNHSLLNICRSSNSSGRSWLAVLMSPKIATINMNDYLSHQHVILIACNLLSK